MYTSKNAVLYHLKKTTGRYGIMVLQSVLYAWQ